MDQTTFRCFYIGSQLKSGYDLNCNRNQVLWNKPIIQSYLSWAVLLGKLLVGKMMESPNVNKIYSQTGRSLVGNFAIKLVDNLSQARCNLCEQVAQFIWFLVARTCWDFPKFFKWFFDVLKTGLWVFACMSHWATTKIFLIAWKNCTVSSVHLQPANHNIIQRSFFATFIECWQEL